MELTAKIKGAIRDVNNFPKEGIVFKDITPIMLDPI
jgi:adenine phosphoribosyltransferase